MANTPHDRFFRIAFAHARDAAAWLKTTLPREIAAEIAWDDLHLVSGDLPDEGTGATRSDLVFRTTLRGQSVVVVIAFEHQRRNHRHMPVRSVAYSLQQLRAWMRENPTATELPMILSVVLHQGPGAWTARLDLRDAVPLSDDLRAVFGPYLVGQRAILLDLTRQPELLQAGPPPLRVATRLLAHRGARGRAELLRAMRSDLRLALRDRGPAFQAAVQRYTLETGPADAVADVCQALQEIEEDEPMRRTAAHVYDELIATGEARGVAIGEARGVAIGEAKGKVGILLQLGARLFGDASDRTREHLLSLSSEQLTAVADRMLQASSWDEALPAR